MEMRRCELNGEIYTKFKVKCSEYPRFKALLDKYGITEIDKKSSRFVYLIKKGDWLNPKFKMHYLLGRGSS